MFINFIKQINWVDIFIVILCARICYIAVKGGFPLEFFKFLGVVAALYLSLHYYVALSEVVFGYISIAKEQISFVYLLIFIILALIGYLAFALLRNLFERFLKVEAVSTFNKWGGLFLGLIRSVLFSSLILFIFILSGIGYLKESVKSSYAGRNLLAFAPQTYSALWNGVASKFAIGETFNGSVVKTVEDVKGK
jgi:uncharacterized membrane protein required for colicin V production